MTINEVLSNNPSALRRRDSRRKLARDLADLFSFWSYSEMESFVEEMRGLDLQKKEDVQTFVDMLSAWHSGVDL